MLGQSVNTFLWQYVPLRNTLATTASEDKSKCGTKARGLFEVMLNFQILFSLTVCQRTLDPVEMCCILQQADVSAADAKKAASRTKIILGALRSEAEISSLWQSWQSYQVGCYVFKRKVSRLGTAHSFSIEELLWTTLSPYE